MEKYFQAPQGKFRVFILDTVGEIFHLNDVRQEIIVDFDSVEVAVAFIRDQQTKLDLAQRTIEDIDWWIFDDKGNKVFANNAQWRSG